MRIVTLYHPTGHAYWQRGEFKVQLPDCSFFDIQSLMRYSMGYEIWIDDAGNIMFAECNCSSGGGKKRFYDPSDPWHKEYEWATPRAIVKRSGYDKIEYIGKELTISPELIDDLIANHFNQ
jgi:hypothetical protein